MTLLSNLLIVAFGNTSANLFWSLTALNFLYWLGLSFGTSWKTKNYLFQPQKDEQRDLTLREVFDVVRKTHESTRAATSKSGNGDGAGSNSPEGNTDLKSRQQLLLELGAEVIYTNCTWLLNSEEVKVTTQTFK